MKLTKTVVLKLEEREDSIWKTMEKYTEGMNFASKVVLENGEPLAVPETLAEKKVMLYAEI